MLFFDVCFGSVIYKCLFSAVLLLVGVLMCCLFSNVAYQYPSFKWATTQQFPGNSGFRFLFYKCLQSGAFRET